MDQNRARPTASRIFAWGSAGMSCWRRASQRPGMLLLLLIVLLGSQIRPYWFASDDGAIYYSLARSMQAGVPAERTLNSQMGLPPVYPAVLSTAFFFGDRPFLAASVLHWLIGIASTVGIYFWARRLVGRSWFFVAATTVLNAVYCIVHRRTLKEGIFLALLIWAALLLQWSLESRSRRHQLMLLAGGFVLMSLTILVRYAGIALLPAFLGVAWWMHRERITRRVVVVTLSLACLPVASIVGHAIYQTSESKASGSGTYWGTFGKSLIAVMEPARATESVRLQVTGAGRTVVPGMFKSYGDPYDWSNINTLAYALISIGLLFGYFKLLKRRPDVLLVATPFYFGAYFVWSQNQGGRFLIPMAPVMMAAFIIATRTNISVAMTWLGRSSGRPQQVFLRRGILASRGILALTLTLHVGVALNYDWFVDTPRARVAHRAWSDVEEISERIYSDNGKVMGGSLSYEHHMMVQIGVAQRIRNLEEAEITGDPDLKWIIQPSELPVEPGFEMVWKGENLMAIRRSTDALFASPSEATHQGAVVQTAEAPRGDARE